METLMILVTGATGTIGGHLVRQLAEAGAAFRALVRSEAKGAALGHPFAVGDFDDAESLRAALAGADRLFLCGGGAVPVAHGEPQPMIRQEKAAIDAARAAGVRYVVKVSVWRPTPGAPLSVGAHAEIERHLAASGLAWATLQPTGFMQNFAPGGAIEGAYGTGRVAYVDAADIAACAAALLTAAEPREGAFPLTGPEALTHAEIAARLGVPFRDLPPEAAAAALRARGLPAGFVTDLLTLYAGMAAGEMAEVTPTVRDLTGRAPRSFDDFLAFGRHAGRGGR
ncbi:NAD(P)H-binding protein [Streptomyces millisiae]|uniref:NAD(P)H-binding protein n=1 Tax=Streptomyces millisiae TaxID=3075542 RepID=A0ABU2LY98_9ACTN|nr:NAD(P)H-binding protein [Streptomyces sp. DSM 44918]MDT0322568.1 NAD(P)H-binding protein [Streptomyces sp. DSM 44918]